MDLEKIRIAMIEDILEISGKYSQNDLENWSLMFLESIYREEEDKKPLIDGILNMSTEYTRTDLENLNFVFLKALNRYVDAKKILIDEILNVQKDTLRITENSSEIAELYTHSNLEKMSFTSLESVLKEIIAEHQMKYKEVGEQRRALLVDKILEISKKYTRTDLESKEIYLLSTIYNELVAKNK